MPFVRDTTPPDGAGAQSKRGRLMLAMLLSHPALIHDVEEAFARVALPPAYAKIRDALHSFAAEAKTLDTDSLFTHLSHLGLAEEARLIEALAAEDFRPEPDASLAQVAETWWSLYILMDFSIEMLRAQRDEQEQFWKVHQDDAAAWSRLIKYNELLRQAMTGEYGAADP